MTTRLSDSSEAELRPSGVAWSLLALAVLNAAYGLLILWVVIEFALGRMSLGFTGVLFAWLFILGLLTYVAAGVVGLARYLRRRRTGRSMGARVRRVARVTRVLVFVHLVIVLAIFLLFYLFPDAA